MVLRIIITALVCYFLGNHNGAIFASRMLHDDVREHGSGNAGLTNFIRNYGVNRAFLVIAIDVFKAILACQIGGLVFDPLGYRLEGMTLGGVAVMLGHDFPALQGFRGGNGILSGWFVAFMIDWRIALVVWGGFLILTALTRYVSLGSITLAALFAVMVIATNWANWLVIVWVVLIAGLLIVRHHANIGRLLKGCENKLSFKKK